MKALRCHKPHVVFQECPGEVSLCFSMFGCPLKCQGCHSEDLWDENGGYELTLDAFKGYLTQYKGLISAVVFFGGEWQVKNLQALLKTAQQESLKTCLYTGLNAISRHLRPYLDFAKVGPWNAQLGGLEASSSNQKFYRIEQGQIREDLTHLFKKESISVVNNAKENQAFDSISQQIPLIELGITLVSPSKHQKSKPKFKQVNNNPSLIPHQLDLDLTISQLKQETLENQYAAA